MASFDGPWSKDLEGFKKSVQSTPDQYKSSITSASKATLEKICDPDVLHVWETDSDIDNLLQLTSVIAKLCNLGVRKKRAAQAQDGSMLILVEEKHGRNNFARICQLVEHLTGADGKKHLEGTVVAFGKMVVVRGWDNSILSGQQEAMDKTIKRVNIALDRVFKLGNLVGDKKKIVWHHGAVLHFLLNWISSTTSTLRSSLSGITITGAFDLTTRIAPSAAGRANTLAAFERLESYAKKLDIPIVFLDAASQSITGDYLATYMYFHAYYINTFLPFSLSRPHLHKAQDELVTFAFRLRAASEGRYGSDVVRQVQNHLDASTARNWARTCINKSSYTKELCRAAGREEAIHHAVNLADTPFARLNFPSTASSSSTKITSGKGIPILSRVSIGPASPDPSSHTLALPITLSIRTRSIRPSNPSHMYLVLPAPSQTPEKICARIQGLMMAVLERVRQEHGNPVLGEQERRMWKGVVGACGWALEGCGDKCPKGVEEKTRFVRRKLGEGTWGCALFGGKEGGSSAVGGNQRAGGVGASTGAVQAMQEPVRSYGFGQGTQQTMGTYGTAYPQHLPPQGQHTTIAQSMPLQGQRQMGGMDTATYQGYGQAQVPTQTYTPSPLSPPFAHQTLPQQQHQYSNTAFAQNRAGGPVYEQSMGGPW
ncbi:hypothetical protein T440DRAFT_386340 [Plenodomus tracheiphilus IPT5]|uniref:Uncharacterized protein n=1 Tax=Plenodomus tracheiphilus IPT5 TaxID=1408161 RepID=A0A6A7BI50_9PLEO|nr:hypothetical protein T440DRAFT_386340 [Plenodomus tracheiphilus IPT5]